MFLPKLAMLALAAATSAASKPVGEPPPPAGVLVMPVVARDGVSPDLAESVTAVLATEAGKVPGYKVTTLREVEGVLSAEQLRVLMGCDELSCATEVAGALNADLFVVGSLGKLDDEYLLTLSLINVRSSVTQGRSLERFPALSKKAILDRLPHMVDKLFGIPPRKPPPPSTREIVRGRIALALRVVCTVGMGVGVLGLLLSTPPLAAVAALGVYDWARGYRPGGKHAITQNQALLSNAFMTAGLLGTALALALAPPVITGWGLSVVMP